MRVSKLPGLSPGEVHIGVAEFMAALISTETFVEECAGTLTYLELDNTSAHAWFQADRCPRYPFDRCAQGAHLHMLKANMKVRTRWIPSAENTIADRCSRASFFKKKPEQDICGLRLMRVKPKWNNVLKFTK